MGYLKSSLNQCLIKPWCRNLI